MRITLGLLLIVAATASPDSTPRKEPLTAKAKVALGLLAVDLSMEGDHGFYTGEALLHDLRLGQRLAQRKPLSQDEMFRAFRAQGYVQGMLDGLLDGVNGESAQRLLEVDSAQGGTQGKSLHPVLCISKVLMNTERVVAAVIEDLQRLPRDIRQQSAHMVVADTLLSEDNGFIVPCSF